MKTSTRYSLIAFGFFVFIISAPLLVLYVSGTKLNFGSGNTSSTGILDAKSNPTDATLFIDGIEHSKTPAIARFLNQGEYVFTLKKDGYYDWSKRLPIESGQVTYAQVGVDQVQLIKKNQPVVIEEAGVSSFKLLNDNLWYAQGNNIVYAYINDLSKKNLIPNVGAAPLSITELRDKKHLLISSAKASVLINTANQAVTVLPFIVTQTDQAQMASDDILLYIDGGKLFSYNIITKNKVTLSAEVRAFTVLGNTLYFLKTNGIVSSAIWSNNIIADEQLLLKDVPNSPEEAQLIITDRKELFIKNGRAGLYRVGQTLETITSRVELVTFDSSTNELAFVSAGELWFYNFLTSRAQLLTRTTTGANAFIIHSNIGYGLVAKPNGLEAVEIDTRDQQNRYHLLDGKPVWQVDMTNNQKTIVALQDGSLVMLEVRN